MMDHARNLEFEQAAAARDALTALKQRVLLDGACEARAAWRAAHLPLVADEKLKNVVLAQRNRAFKFCADFSRTSLGKVWIFHSNSLI